MMISRIGRAGGRAPRLAVGGRRLGDLGRLAAATVTPSQQAVHWHRPGRAGPDCHWRLDRSTVTVVRPRRTVTVTVGPPSASRTVTGLTVTVTVTDHAQARAKGHHLSRPCLGTAPVTYGPRSPGDCDGPRTGSQPGGRPGSPAGGKLEAWSRGPRRTGAAHGSI
jgi:hypothetical protein